MLSIVDTSHYNYLSNPTVLKTHGIYGEILKASDGIHYVDPTFLPRARANQAAHLPWTGYHFFHPGEFVAPQVKLFLDLMAEAGHHQFRVALDHEVTDGESPGNASRAADAFMALASHRARYQIMMYTYRAFAWEGNCAGLGQYPLWLADYSRVNRPQVPGLWKKAILWQVGQRQVTGASGGDGPGCDFNLVLDLSTLLVPGVVHIPPKPVAKPVKKPVNKPGKLSTLPRWFHRPLMFVANNEMRGPDVAAMQRRLGVKADSVFGPKTNAAVKLYQSRHHLVVDGIVGKITATLLG